MSESVEFFRYLDFLLRFAPVHPSERELRRRFRRIGVDAGPTFDPSKTVTSEQRAALEAGIADAWSEFEDVREQIGAAALDIQDLYGTRDVLGNKYVRRFAAAALGLFGDSKEEVYSLTYEVQFPGREPKFTMAFGRRDVAAADGGWSITVYQSGNNKPTAHRGFSSQGVNTRAENEDDPVTLLFQRNSPGPESGRNWIPVPEGPFFVKLRIYVPSRAVLNGTWRKPVLIRIPSRFDFG